jgi:hypothetical protein
MFLYIRNGLWYGTAGILLALVLIIGATFGFGWLWGFRYAEAWGSRRDVLLGLRAKKGKNIFHRLGDIWNHLFRN